MNLRWAAAIALTALTLAACGQKPNAHFAGAQATDVPGGGEELARNPRTGDVIDTSSTSGGGGVSSGSDTALGGGDTGSSIRIGGSTGVVPGDTNGVTSTRVKIGFHAPETGAAAVPLADLRAGADLLRKYLNGKGVKVHGRELVSIFRNDRYNPADAIRVCRELVEEEKVFLLVGGAGTDQIKACARYAARLGVPYLSAGVAEAGLAGLNNYFAFTMTYPAQAKPLAEMIKRYNPGSSLGGKVLVDRCPDSGAPTIPACSQKGSARPKVAMAYSDSDGFYDARDAFKEQWKRVSGRDLDYVAAITKFSISASQASDLVQRLQSRGIDVVYINTAPTNWLTILRTAEQQRYAPRWVGVGLTQGVNLVPTTACGQSRRSYEFSLFLNPWYSVNHRNTYQFAEAWRTYHAGDYRDHDIAWGLWGGSLVQHAMFNAVGRDLTRSKFIAVSQNLRGVRAVDSTRAGNLIDVYSRNNFSPTDRFGADQAHLLYGNCTARRWLDVPGKQFISGF